jgi:hypothetical protein
VASVRRIDADNFIDTAKPPASSDEELILEPLESLWRLFWRLTLVLLRLYAAMLEAPFILILIIFVFLYFYDLCGFRAASGRFFMVFDLTLPDFPENYFKICGCLKSGWVGNAILGFELTFSS